MRRKTELKILNVLLNAQFSVEAYKVLSAAHIHKLWNH